MIVVIRLGDLFERDINILASLESLDNGKFVIELSYTKLFLCG